MPVPAGMLRDVLWSVSSSGMGGFWNESSPQVGLGFAAGVRSRAGRDPATSFAGLRRGGLAGPFAGATGSSIKIGP